MFITPTLSHHQDGAAEQIKTGKLVDLQREQHDNVPSQQSGLLPNPLGALKGTVCRMRLDRCRSANGPPPKLWKWQRPDYYYQRRVPDYWKIVGSSEHFLRPERRQPGLPKVNSRDETKAQSSWRNGKQNDNKHRQRRTLSQI